MVTGNGVSLKVDPQKGIGVTDIINMLKGLRSEAVIEIVKTSESNTDKVVTSDSHSEIYVADNFNQIPSVKGNTDLPQIRELNEIAALLRSMDVQQNQIGY